MSTDEESKVADIIASILFSTYIDSGETDLGRVAEKFVTCLEASGYRIVPIS